MQVEISAEPLSLPPPERAVTLVPVLIPGGLGCHKWCDRRLLDTFGGGNSVSLIVDQDDDVLEAAWANVWLLEGRRIVTPPADGRLLPGVTRALLLGLAHEVGLTLAEEPISLSRARGADAVFLTSSLRHAVGAVIEEGASGKRCKGVIRTIREALGGAWPL